MTVKRDDAILVEDMIAAAEPIATHIQGMTVEEFFQSKVVQDAVLYELAVLGEAANAISSTFVADHPDIPWRSITGMRHRVIQGYGSVDLDIVWDAAARNVGELLRKLKALDR